MLTRAWVFIDAHGHVTEMKGPGARGVTPVLRPGDGWQYESGSTLSTPSGSMRGSFQFETLRDVSGVRGPYSSPVDPPPPAHTTARLVTMIRTWMPQRAGPPIDVQRVGWPARSLPNQRSRGAGIGAVRGGGGGRPAH